MSVSDRAGKVVGHSLRWIGLAAVSVGGWALFAALGLTAPSLFAALVVAVVFALTGLGPAAVPRPLSMAAQGTLAVTIGLMLDTETLGALGENWIPAVLVGAGTLVVSAGCGALLALHRDVDPVTGALSLIAGGATGLVSIARELGGDERIVAVVQYLRVALVVVTMPLIVTFAFHADSGSGAAREEISTPWYLGTAFLLGAVVTGIVLARLIRLPAPATLGPLIVAGACELLGWPVDISVPTVLLPVAFIVIGWQAGLAFTTASLRAIGRIFPWAALLVLSIGLVCALFGWALSAVTGVSMLTGYLATTPGGLAAVLAVSATTGSDVTFVACVQVIRLVSMLVAAPLAAAAYTRLAERKKARAATESTVGAG
ncbi:AbrB family transcriptional regulator [Rhodococcus sp. SBT000017]|uniref:AbrB family transcriptional regulator n=1 Tax=unclassified Rhodococcus (in: high G+C Gram-positive bacteria) TaxID=192944 RepID=UPI000EF87D52|nr:MULTISPECIES: AbrB family transcriptional regulator [unclassified Rhodococcus (in: high G+C Gram-positive bacteria)]RMB76972.1 AbrB family transcriptional regulator [Rhodococcus sp. SBT000017]